MRPSARAAALEPSPSLAVSSEVRRLRALGRDILDLGLGEPSFPAVAAAKRAVVDAVARDDSHYGPSVGNAELRAAIAAFHSERHGSRLAADDVVIGGGAKPLLYQLLQAFVDPGDEVACSAPYWVSFPAQVALAGGRFVPAPADPADGFIPRAAHLEAVLTPRTRAVIVNSPNNPSGAIMPPEEVEALVRLCARRELLLVMDEVYDFLVFEDRHVSPLRFRDLHPGGIACVGAASKIFAMTGWRLGWCLAPGEPARLLGRLQDHVTSNASTLAQAAALAAFAEGLDEARANVEEWRHRRDLAVAGLRACEGVTVVPPAGTFFAFPGFDLGTGRPVDSARLAVHLLREAGVALVPGAAFGHEGHLRLSFAASRDTIARGCEALAAEMRRLRRDPERLS